MIKPGHACFRSRGFAVFVVVAALLAGVGVGTVAAQEQISNAQELQDVRNDLDGDYVVTDDIDLSGVSNFNPIGDFNNPFTGTFDGNGHNITGLTIDRPDELDVGLFGGVGPGGTVKNVSLRNVDVSGGEWVGALVGTNEGVVRGSSATGDVVAANRTGGLVGTNTASGKVIESYAKGNVTAELIAGGLAGRNAGEISRSYANVSVSGFANIRALDTGGLVGVNVGDITQSYARGEVLGDVSVGGLVGASDGKIVESYASGKVVGDDDTGGLVGNLSFGSRQTTLRGSYWDTEETNQQDAAGVQFRSATVQNVDGLLTEEMFGDAAPGNMTAFDFTNTWATVTNPDGYPVLAWQVKYDIDRDPANFEVSIDSTNSPVTEGDRLTVNATVTNTGGRQGTQTVTANASGLGSNMTTLSLSDGSSTTENFTIPTSPGDAGSYTVTVESENATATTTVTIEQASTGGGSLSPNNPFGDSSNNPLSRRMVINRVIEWNKNGTIGGTPFTRREIIDFVVEWNTAT